MIYSVISLNEPYPHEDNDLQKCTDSQKQSSRKKKLGKMYRENIQARDISLLP